MGKWLSTQPTLNRRFDNICLDLLHMVDYHQARRQKFSEGGSFDTAGGWGGGALKAPRSPWVFGASCNLAISGHFIQTFGKPFSITNF